MQLYFYNERYESKINDYMITKEQLRFTIAPKECLELAKEDNERYPILAIKDEQLVTFFVLHMNKGVKPYSNNEEAILIRSFSTDFRYQEQGFAKTTLRLLPQFVKRNFNKINEMILAVNLQNKAAQSLYKKCGFVDEGERRMGSKGELIIMSYHL